MILSEKKIYSLQLGTRGNQTRCKRDPVYARFWCQIKRQQESIPVGCQPPTFNCIGVIMNMSKRGREGQVWAREVSLYNDVQVEHIRTLEGGGSPCMVRFNASSVKITRGLPVNR